MRLRRVGAKKQPAYRIVIADARAPRDGRFIEIVGHYNPLTDPATVVIKSDRALYWLKQGAQPTDVVRAMLVRKGIWAVYTGEATLESLVEEAPAPAPAPIVEEAPEETAAPAEEATPEEATPEEAPVEVAEETADEEPA